jgi:hypothetical protein
VDVAVESLPFCTLISFTLMGSKLLIIRVPRQANTVVI